MDVMRTHVAGVDVHKEMLVITTMVGEADRRPKVEHLDCSTFTEDLEATGRRLVELGIVDVAMESSGVYWKPVHNVWHKQGIALTIGNASHMRNVPGRKTDKLDSQWIAKLHRNGLIRPSFVPRAEFQELRALTRHRRNLVHDETRIKNRIIKVLEDGNVKLTSVVNDAFCVGGRAVIDAIAKGETNADVLTGKVTTAIKRKEDLHKALTNCLTPNHCYLVGELVAQLKAVEARLSSLALEIEHRFAPYRDLVTRLDEIPGVDEATAQVIIAEATNDVSSFRNERFFAAWAGVAPGNKESAKVRRRSRCRFGNPTLKTALVQAARGAANKKGSYFQAKYRRLVGRLGSRGKATVAIANRLARVVYHLIANPNARYRDLGEARANPKISEAQRAMQKLRSLGFKVTFDDEGKGVSVTRTDG